MHSEICPICAGAGKKPDGTACHGCDRKGWVALPDDAMRPTVIIVTPPQPAYAPPVYVQPAWPQWPWPQNQWPYVTYCRSEESSGARAVNLVGVTE
jgi:hypothetical protein